MNLRLTPTKLCGTVPAIASKSMAHRLLVCSALADYPTHLVCSGLSQDILATIRCLSALGAHVQQADAGVLIWPGAASPDIDFYCGESGTTLRFLLPVMAALGRTAVFHLEGRLGQRPLAPLAEELRTHGVNISKPDTNTLTISGQLLPGDYTLPGNVSSQYISGLLLALPLLNSPSRITVLGTLESAPYVDMTTHALSVFGVPVIRQGNQFVLSPATYSSPGTVQVEGDWSNAAFWLAANALESRITVTGLHEDSLQGDKAIGTILSQLGGGREVNVSQTPDLFPILAVVATAALGETHFVGGARLRLKESDRLQTVAQMIAALGGKVIKTGDGLTILPSSLAGGTVDSAGDHRIVMAAAIAATRCSDPVTILGAQATEKSYPGFWVDYSTLGGLYEEV